MATDPMEIRQLTVDDAGELLTLQRAAYVTEAQRYGDPHLAPLNQTLQDLVSELRRPDVVAFGVRRGDRLVGAVRVRCEAPVAHVCRLVVAPDAQGEGIGSALLGACEGYAGSHPDGPGAIREMRLFTGSESDGTLRLYERHGYRRQREEQQRTHRLVHLAKPLVAKPLVAEPPDVGAPAI